jgi:Fe2+ or Zn2+ uptake regulation protein
MKSEIEVFREFTRKKGLRNTPERETIIKEIFATHDHFDVDELPEKQKKEDFETLYIPPDTTSFRIRLDSGGLF